MMEEDKFGELCNRVFGISKGIAATGVIIDDQHLVYKTNDIFQLPEDRDRLRHMLKQSYIMINEPMANEDFFGKVKYVMIHHETYDVFLFRILSDPLKILGVVVTPREYDHNEFVEAITYELLSL
ncbi:MAG: hypothetical protein ACREA4_02245 [Nitrososphaera sp.]